jgi:hypothetical protein
MTAQRLFALMTSTKVVEGQLQIAVKFLELARAEVQTLSTKLQLMQLQTQQAQEALASAVKKG